jgi:hypothetical protein
MGASLAMIDKHYGHLARDGREHAVALLDGYARDSAAWTPPGRRNRSRPFPGETRAGKSGPSRPRMPRKHGGSDAGT